MIAVTVPLFFNTLLSNVRYAFTIAGVPQATQSSGVSQPDPSFPLFRILLEVPEGAEELLVFDVTDASNFNLVNFELDLITV